MKTSTSLKPYSTLSLYAAGLTVGCAVLFLDYGFSSAEQRHYDFLKTYQTRTWLLLLIMQIIFWFAALVPLYRIREFLKAEYLARREETLHNISGDNQKKGPNKGGTFLLILMPLLFLVFLKLSSISPACADYGFLHSSIKTSILTWTGYGIATIAAMELLLIGVELATMFDGDGPSEQRLTKYIALRRYALRLLTILGVMTTLAVLGMTAKAYAIGAACKFPVQSIFLYAVFLSTLLALGFFPTYAGLLRTGHKLVRDLLPMPPLTDESWSSWLSKKKGLEELLQLSVTENIRAAMAILAPIVGGLIPLLNQIRSAMSK
jgi:hypothetical protein